MFITETQGTNNSKQRRVQQSISLTNRTFPLPLKFPVPPLSHLHVSSDVITISDLKYHSLAFLYMVFHMCITVDVLVYFYMFLTLFNLSQSKFNCFFLLFFSTQCSENLFMMINVAIAHSVSLLYSFLLCEYIIVQLLSVFNNYTLDCQEHLYTYLLLQVYRSFFQGV